MKPHYRVIADEPFDLPPYMDVYRVQDGGTLTFHRLKENGDVGGAEYGWAPGSWRCFLWVQGAPGPGEAP